MRPIPLLLGLLGLISSAHASLRIAGDPQAPGMAPILRAYPDGESVSFVPGGISALFGPQAADVAVTSELDTLRATPEHPQLRVIFTLAERYPRILAKKSSGIALPKDLRGRRIGAVPGTPAHYFLEQMLARAGLGTQDVSVIPLHENELPTALESGKIDALAADEPLIGPITQRLGNETQALQGPAVYRELLNLTTTADTLASPARRKELVHFVAQLIRASAMLRAEGAHPGELLFAGGLAHDLPDVMAEEDRWLAPTQARSPRSRAQLLAFIDPTIRIEALAQPAAADSRLTSQPLRERIERLALAVEDAESLRAVKRLQLAYAQHLQGGRWQEAAALLARDGEVQFGEEHLHGRAALHDYLRRTMGQGREGLAPKHLNLRMILSPVVNLTEDGHALARWHEIAMLGERGRSASWEGGIYENEYVREDGVWRISRLHFYPQYAGSYEAGWRSLSKTPFVVPYHYDPRTAGIPSPVPSPQRHPLTPVGADLSLTLASLASRIQRMHDAAAVENLQHAYGYYMDRGMWNDVADLFAPQGVFRNGQEVYTGQDRLRRALLQHGEGHKPGELDDHLQLETLITVLDDARATARGIDLGMSAAGGTGEWSQSLYEAQYRKHKGTWVIQSLRLHPQMRADYQAGWGRSDLLPEGPVQEPPPASHPDRPLTTRPTVRPSTPGQLLEKTQALERQLAQIQAREGAENVSNAYGYYIDEFRWGDTAALFSKDGWKELSYIGVYVGRERVRDSMVLRYGSKGRTGPMMTLHQKTQPVIDVSPDGRSARIRERLFQINSAVDAPGSYIGGIYENEIINEDGVWKIAGMDLDYVWTSSYSVGWAHARAQDSRRFAPGPDAPPPPLLPDRPLRGVVYAPFPDIVDVPFHYTNPVSGRTPPVLLLP